MLLISKSDESDAGGRGGVVCICICIKGGAGCDIAVGIRQIACLFISTYPGRRWGVHHGNRLCTSCLRGRRLGDGDKG